MFVGQGTKPALLAPSIEPWSIAVFAMRVVTNSAMLNMLLDFELYGLREIR